MQDVGQGAPSGEYIATPLKTVKYGPESIESLQHVISQVLPSGTEPKSFIVTGKSLAKTPVIPLVEEQLKSRGVFHGTFTGIRQHTPIEDVEQVLDIVRKEGINLLVAVGGGSPIDACKTISYFHNKRYGSFLTHIAIPTTLSAAEYTQLAGHTNKDGNKTPVTADGICPSAVILDPNAAMHTPQNLWTSTGLRALDHALEGLYRPGAQYPSQQMALIAIRDLFTFLPKCVNAEGKDLEARQRLQIASWMSLYPSKLTTALGPSHALGHALGATYSIPHGICSVLTLAATVRLMAKTLPAGPRSMLANTFSYLPTSYVRDHNAFEGSDAEESACLATAHAIDKLIDALGLKTRLSDFKVPREDLPKIAKSAYKATAAKPGWDTLCPSEDTLLKEILEKIW